MEELIKILSENDALLSIAAGVGAVMIILLVLMIMNLRARDKRRSAADSVADASEMEEKAPSELELLREELASSVKGMSDSVARAMADVVRAQAVKNDAFYLKLGELDERKPDEAYKDALSEVAAKMDAIANENNLRMDAMLRAVDQKLGATLDERFDTRFQRVSEQMDDLTRGIEDVRALSRDMYDLKRVLSGAKVGGMLGEAQLSMLLSDILSPEQYEENVPVREDGEAVAAVVRIPGKTAKDTASYLPIDAKFSKESSTQLLFAIDGGDPAEIESAWTHFEDALLSYARHIQAEFIRPPKTTDFAVLFFPSDGLYAQALRRPNAVARVQDECRVLLAGPSTLSALLNSLQMGLRTLAIERRSEEVWATLSAVRGEFVNFADALSKTQKRIHQASDAIEDAARKSRAIEQKLKAAEALDGGKKKELFQEPTGDDGFFRAFREDWE